MKQTKFKQAAQTNLYVAQLMSPDDVAAALSERGSEEKEKLHNHWIFCADTGPEMFEALRKESIEKISRRITGLKSSNGGCYGVITHEIQGYQHRLLLPLYDAEVQHCITALENEPYGFLLGNNNKKDALILFEDRINGQGMQGLPGLRAKLGSDKLKAFISELPDVVATLTTLDTIPTMLEHEIQSLSVSIVMPYHSMELVEKSFA
jgi:hypothetical protein